MFLLVGAVGQTCSRDDNHCGKTSLFLLIFTNQLSKIHSSTKQQFSNLLKGFLGVLDLGSGHK